MALVFLVMLGRLVDLQILRGSEYRKQYELMLQRKESLPAVRGRVLDRSGYILAMDRPCFDLCLDYGLMARDEKWIKNKTRRIRQQMNVTKERSREILEQRIERTWDLVRQVAIAKRKADLKIQQIPAFESQRAIEELQRTVQKITRRIQRIRKNVGEPTEMENEAYPVVAGLTEELAVRFIPQMAEATGAEIRPGSIRQYPYDDLACHIIGFTRPVDANDLKKHNVSSEDYDWFERNRVNYHSDDWIGRIGVEKLCEPLLRGKRGYRLRRSGKVIQEQAPENGQDVHLTLDIRMQREITRLFTNSGYNGSAVVMSVGTREILSMVSVPTYNLNRYRQDYQDLVRDGLNLPLQHRAISRHYPPGSTMKPLAALAGLAGGVIYPDKHIYCKGRLFERYWGRWRCWKRSGHGDLDLYGAIQRSCNIYFYKTGEWLGLDRLTDWYRQIGCERVPGTGLYEEVPGTLAKVDERQDVGEARLLAIGQGPIGLTPLHVVDNVAMIASNGVVQTPLLVLEIGQIADAPKMVRKQMELVPEHFEAIKEGMYRAVNKQGGTLYRVFKENPPLLTCAGKSGTADIQPHKCDVNGNGIIDAGEELSGNMAWTICFAPYENPQVAVAVVVEYTPEHGGEAGGPIARDIIHMCEKLGYIKP